MNKKVFEEIKEVEPHEGDKKVTKGNRLIQAIKPQKIEDSERVILSALVDVC